MNWPVTVPVKAWPRLTGERIHVMGPAVAPPPTQNKLIEAKRYARIVTERFL